MSEHRYSEEERDAIYKVIAERRDMRHFLSDPIDEALLTRLLAAAHAAPSVGLMQPWRFIRISDSQLRETLYQLVEQERMATADALGERREDFLKLKVEGIKDCAEVLVVTLADQREQHIFGRRTMPQMDLASVACAIQNLWLAARAEGIGVGWVSIFEPDELARVLELPEGAEPVAILCLGQVEAFYPAPMLELEDWTHARPLEEMLMENRWSNTDEPK